jgi:hypothetical protein
VSAAAFDTALNHFTPSSDAQLVQAINRITSSKTVSLGTAAFSAALQKEAANYKFLSDKKFSELELRVELLRFFNDSFKAVLPSVNLSLSAQQSYLSAAVFGARDLVLWSSKEPIWMEAMSRTAQSLARECSDIVIKISLFAANELVEKKKTDWRFERSVFGQLHKELLGRAPTIFRLEPLKRAWKVELVGLNAVDVGMSAHMLFIAHPITLSKQLFVSFVDRRWSVPRCLRKDCDGAAKPCAAALCPVTQRSRQ